MRQCRLAVRIAGIPAAVLFLAGALTGATPTGASAVACAAVTGFQPPNPGTNNFLTSVAAVSPCDAWAVGGYYFSDVNIRQTLIVHWDGSAWAQQPSPNPGGPAGISDLNGVAATSPSNAWAVGSYSDGGAQRTLVEHWNGTAWTRAPSPNRRGPANTLNAVAAVSASNAWAVGSTGFSRTLIEHWNGKAWKIVPSPTPASGAELLGVAATSASNAWAVGATASSKSTVILHWNGAAWKRVTSPNPGAGNGLRAVTALSARSAWAVGFYNDDAVDRTLIEHWNGSRWTRVASRSPGVSGSFLNGVAAASARNVWAVGRYTSNNAAFSTLIEHWNGAAWRRVASPGLSSAHTGFFGAAASSSRDVWAVGSYGNGAMEQTLAVHCCQAGQTRRPAGTPAARGRAWPFRCA